MTVCLLLASVPGLAPYAYAGVGLFIAPIFPTGLPWLNRAAPRARRAGALVIAASMIGGVAAGPALGKAIEWSGVRAVPLLLGAVSAAVPAGHALADPRHPLQFAVPGPSLVAIHEPTRRREAACARPL